jgi:hypothetical protein
MREAATRPRVEACCVIVGAAARLPEVLALMLPRARDAASDARARADALLCAAHAVRGAGAARPGRVGPEVLAQLLTLLADPEVGQSEDAHTRAAALAAAHALLDACPAAAATPHVARLAAVALLLRASDWLGGAAGGGGSRGWRAGEATAVDWDAVSKEAAEAERLLQHLADAAAAAGSGEVVGEDGAGGSVDALLKQHRSGIVEVVSWQGLQGGGRAAATAARPCASCHAHPSLAPTLDRSCRGCRCGCTLRAT